MSDYNTCYHNDDDFTDFEFEYMVENGVVVYLCPAGISISCLTDAAKSTLRRAALTDYYNRKAPSEAEQMAAIREEGAANAEYFASRI